MRGGDDEPDYWSRQAAAEMTRIRYPEGHLLYSLHGDDFTAVRPKNSLDWFREQLEQELELEDGARLW